LSALKISKRRKLKMSEQRDVLDKINGELKEFEEKYQAKYLLVVTYPYDKKSEIGDEHFYQRASEGELKSLVGTLLREMEKK
jgi:hypothetical protein